MQNTTTNNNKRFALALFTLVAAACLLCTACACSQGSFKGEIDNKTGIYQVTADNAGKDSAIKASGAIVLGEGQMMVVDSKLSSGAVVVKLISSAGETVIEETVEGTNSNGFGTIAATYTLEVDCAKNGTTGTIEIAVVDDDLYQANNSDLQKTLHEMQQWTKGSSTSEAAQVAGFEEFVLPEPDSQLQNGPVGTWLIRSMKGRIVAKGSVGPAQIEVMKGIYAGNGDISSDEREYAHTWYLDVNGMEVRCQGNVEGQAHKTVWIDGNYSYCIMIWGQGEYYLDFGLGAQDIAALVATIK